MSSVMAVENKSQGTSSIASVLAEPESVVLLNGIIPVGSDHTPKVRKPYTISKQREKWTEEEHQKFLEALKLYGRGWRQIEEHIGTKTAVQIRSHAQKFFSKVSREGPDSIDNSIKPIEIPPPRPKRKPVHPYPRKVVHSHDGVSVSFQPERSPSPNLKTSERQNQSPTSVLSANVSNVLESPVSEQHSGCLSPASCTTDMHSINLLSVVKGNAYSMIGSSAEKERGSFSLVQTPAGSVEANAAFMKIDMGSKNTLCTKEDGTADAQSTTFKLFGKTVLVSDYQKPSASAMENVNARSSKDSQENYGIDNINSAYAPSNELNMEFSLGDIYTNWNQQPCGVPVFHSMGFQKDGSNTAVATTDACVPWWALYQGLSFACLPSYNRMPEDSGREEGMRENENHKEISCTGSNTGSVGEVESTEKNFDAVDSNCQHPLPEDRSNRSNCARGFVPYKRCLAERNISSSVVVDEEREGQRIRVCS